MVDPFRISSGDSKIPNFSTKKEYDQIIEQIGVMEPSTAYVAVQGVVVPTLNALHNNPPPQNTTLPSPLMYAPSKTSTSSLSGAERSHQILKELQEQFANIQKQITDLYENRQEIADRWLDSTESKPIQPDDQVLKNFYYSRQNIEKNLDQIKNGITEFEKQMPASKDKENFVQQLKKYHSDLASNIPNPKNFNKDNGNWQATTKTIIDQKGKNYVVRFWWKESASTPAKVMKWEDSGDSSLPKNPLGIFEMVVDNDRSKYNDFVTTLSRGKHDISAFYKTAGSRTLHPFVARELDTQAAYMYLITVFLPLLQNESAQALEEQGETMKQVAKVYDKWSEIQSEINELAKIIQTLKEKGLINESGKLEIKDISIQKSFESGKPIAVIKIKDPNGSFEPLINKSQALEKKIGEMQNLLQDLEKKLPPSQQTLIETMKKLTSQLTLKRDAEYIFYYHDDKTDLRFEMQNEFVKISNLNDFEYARKFIFSTMHKEYFFLADEDQTKFKAYMDNIAQGITALTSISNMTQQELQIATQYHNSLLGLQKSAFDSLNKTMQSILNNMR